MKGRGAARARAAGREREGSKHRTAGQERAGRPPPLRRRRPGAASLPQVPQRVSPRRGWARASASRRSCQGVPGWRRAQARARGRGRCPAALGRLRRPRPRPGRAAWVATGSSSMDSGSLSAGSLLWGCLGFPERGLDPVTQPIPFPKIR